MAAEKPAADIGKTEGLHKKFLIIGALVVVLPSLFMFYILYSGHISLRPSHLFISAFILLLALMGLMILRLVFENVFAISTSIRRSTESGEPVSVNIRENVAELNEISLSFNNLMQKLYQTMEALRESEELFHSLVDNMLDTTLILDWDGKILFANEAGAKLVALNTAAEGVGMNVIDFIHSDSHGDVISDQSKVWNGQGGFLAEYRLKTLTGDQRWVEGLGTKITFRGHPANLVTLRDITSRKAVEKELLNTLTELRDTKDLLVQSEKLAAIGRLSAGVAHEILNPVNIISMRLQLMETMNDLPESVRQTLAIFKEQLQRITSITKNLSQFSRLSRKHAQLNNLNGLIEHVLTLTAPLFSEEKVSMELHLDNDLPALSLDKDRIEQVLFNIIINAVTAMEDRENKRIRITTDRIAGDSGEVFLRIAIADNGHGIRDEDRNRLFDPFFTTRQSGKGTGLGLFISYGIVQDHGGRIWAENNESGGASFYIQLPLDGIGKQTPHRYTDQGL